MEPVEVNHIAIKDAIDLSTVLRTAGLTVDLIFTAVLFELCKKYEVKKSDISIKEINSLIDEILKDPEYASIHKQQQEAQMTKNAKPPMEVVK